MSELVNPPVVIRYRNFWYCVPGAQRLRKIQPLMLWHGSTNWHPEPQWLLTAIDLDDPGKPMKDFAMSGILEWGVKEGS